MAAGGLVTMTGWALAKCGTADYRRGMRLALGLGSVVMYAVHTAYI